MAQLHTPALGSLFVVFSDLQVYGEGVLPRLHRGWEGQANTLVSVPSSPVEIPTENLPRQITRLRIMTLVRSVIMTVTTALAEG
jgi:hypothetical protein